MKNLPIAKIAAAILAFVVAWLVIDAVMHRTHRDEDRKVKVTSGLAEMNKALPAMIDNVTRLDSVATSDGTDVVYHLSIVGASVQKVTADDLKPMKAQVAKSYCDAPQLKIFRDLDMTLKYKYYREDGSFISEIDAVKSDCPK